MVRLDIMSILSVPGLRRHKSHFLQMSQILLKRQTMLFTVQMETTPSWTEFSLKSQELLVMRK